jgi:hypothetical protein
MSKSALALGLVIKLSTNNQVYSDSEASGVQKLTGYPY